MSCPFLLPEKNFRVINESYYFTVRYNGVEVDSISAHRYLNRSVTGHWKRGSIGPQHIQLLNEDPTGLLAKLTRLVFCIPVRSDFQVNDDLYLSLLMFFNTVLLIIFFYFP